RALTDMIRRHAARIPYMEVVGDPHQRLPHIASFSYPFEDGEPLQAALDKAGFAVSAGSSCTASTLRPSHVLEAMGVLSHGNIRVSLHRDVTTEDVDRFLTVLPDAVARLRDEGGVAPL
ncbi:MAG: aminotransferase class V-fold PLP-dependent enzyme, partial [Stackebrandtia sp.]